MRDNTFDNDFETGNIFDIFEQTGVQENDSDLDEARELYATMGFQMEYTDALKEKKDNRKLEEVQFIEIDSKKNSEITQKLISIYGAESMQVKKWVEQLEKIELYRAAQTKAVQKRKYQVLIMRILCAISALIVIGIVFFALNSTTYYINQGDYRYIYKKTLFGQPECYQDVSASGLIKNKSYLYYKSNEDNKLYRLSTRNNNPESLADNTVSDFRIIDDYIYYINESDKKLYRILLTGGMGEKIYDEPCSKLSVDKKSLLFEAAAGGKMLDTKTLQVSEK